jgi:hypothetical protein
MDNPRMHGSMLSARSLLLPLLLSPCASLLAASSGGTSDAPLADGTAAGVEPAQDIFYRLFSR